MVGYQMDAAVEKALAEFSLPEDLGFAKVAAPVMFEAEYRDGSWHSGVLKPFGEIRVYPNARSLQFSEVVFEGMKAYRYRSAPPHLFRPIDHWKRLNGSAERLGMPAPSLDLFLGGISAVVSACSEFIPQDDEAFLYLRPFVMSCEPGYSVVNSAHYRFYVVASPSGPYLSGEMRAQIERQDVRAARGGTGTAKTGGNYAAALRATSKAVQNGYSIALWLDPVDRLNIEEFSGMNVFAVIEGALHTPSLTDSILAGITRDSVIRLARHLEIEVVERIIPVNELLENIDSGRCKEVFATGTAAILSSVGEIGDHDGRVYRLPSCDVADKLRSELVLIQTRNGTDPFGWTQDVNQ